MKFNYQARNPKGDLLAGQIEASSKEAAAVLLQKHGMFVTLLEAADTGPGYTKKVKFGGGISRKDLVIFSRQLAIMFKSKVPLIESLKVLAAQSTNIELKEKIFKIAEEVEGGTSLSKAFSLYPNLFSTFYIAMVKSGEVSGKLTDVLNYLAEHLEREYHLISKTRSALTYPILVIMVAIVVLLLMVYFVIPNLAEVLLTTSEGKDLPAGTKLVIGLSNAFRHYSWAVILVFVAFVLLIVWFYFTKEGKELFDDIILKIPVIGEFVRLINMARFAENLSTLVSGGLPIALALETVADIMGHYQYKEAVILTTEKVRDGEPISSVLFQYPQLFSPVFVQMVVVGEKTGSLDNVLLNIVDFYQKEIDRSIESLLAILEPALIIFLAVIVGGMMLAILTPLYSITETF